MMGAIWTLGEPGEGTALPRVEMQQAREEHERETKNKQKREHGRERTRGSTPQSTQLRGSPKVIIRQLLHLLCIYDQICF